MLIIHTMLLIFSSTPQKRNSEESEKSNNNLENELNSSNQKNIIETNRRNETPPSFQRDFSHKRPKLTDNLYQNDVFDTYQGHTSN